MPLSYVTNPMTPFPYEPMTAGAPWSASDWVQRGASALVNDWIVVVIHSVLETTAL
jgi:hypothetical protein